MAYNPGFPVSYQPYYPQAFQMPAQQNPQPAQANAGIIWVQGEAGAKSYLVAPNNTVQLWDSESQTIYLKSADASGMPSMLYFVFMPILCFQWLTKARFYSAYGFAYQSAFFRAFRLLFGFGCRSLHRRF